MECDLRIETRMVMTGRSICKHQMESESINSSLADSREHLIAMAATKPPGAAAFDRTRPQ